MRCQLIFKDFSFIFRSFHSFAGERHVATSSDMHRFVDLFGRLQWPLNYRLWWKVFKSWFAYHLHIVSFADSSLRFHRIGCCFIPLDSSLNALQLCNWVRLDRTKRWSGKSRNVRNARHHPPIRPSFGWAIASPIIRMAFDSKDES